jgi:hypothetical protein
VAPLNARPVEGADAERTPAPLLFVFATALAFYVATLAPTVTWGDSAWLATDAFRGPIGFTTAGDHPLFLLIARGFTWLPGDVGRNVNLVSALFGALTVMLVFRVARQLGARPAAALTGAAALCVSHAFWLHSVVAEVYTANAFFLTSVITLLLDWRRTGRWPWLMAAIGSLALGLANHLVLGTAIPAIVIFIALNIPAAARRWMAIGVLVAAALVLVVVVAWPGAGLFVRRVWEGPPGIGEYFDLHTDPQALIVEMAYYVAYLLYQFPSIALGLGLLGAVMLWRADRAAAWLLLAAWGGNAFVFVRHTVWPSAGSMKFVFYISDYVVFAVLCAVGAEWLMRRWRSGVRGHLAMPVGLVLCATLLPPAVYAIVPAMAKRLGRLTAAVRPIPYRDTERFFLNPNKRGDRGARRFGEEAMRAVAPGAVIFADYTPYAVLRYLQVVEHRRPDVALRSSTAADQIVRVRPLLDAQGNRRPLYVAGNDPAYYDLPAAGVAFESSVAGPLLRLSPPVTATADPRSGR